jgi:hypothetical protein
MVGDEVPNECLRRDFAIERCANVEGVRHDGWMLNLQEDADREHDIARDERLCTVEDGFGNNTRIGIITQNKSMNSTFQNV